MTTFDLWLTHQPTGDDIEPTQRHLEDARDQLSDDGGDMPSDDQVYALACMLAVEEARAAQDEADEHAAESSREDSEYFEGDGPL
jgi:hypothetical protein